MHVGEVVHSPANGFPLLHWCTGGETRQNTLQSVCKDGEDGDCAAFKTLKMHSPPLLNLNQVWCLQENSSREPSNTQPLPLFLQKRPRAGRGGAAEGPDLAGLHV